MALSAFDDKSAPPQDDEVMPVLGRSGRLWDALVAFLAAEYAPLLRDWKFGGREWGWTLQLKQRQRTILYLTPCRNYFIVGFALGEKAIAVARRSEIPQPILKAIQGAKKYAEGRAVRLEVRKKSDLEIVKKLAIAKMVQ